ncbi:MAG: nicotinate (nicotinamide) nucleotide adenylyltransferase [Deltaproteobacteria bacterium]|nr:nicotinate (nicotinamide) nucleotide adenylyltransferase [Deltaproteobacteria bacterium]
MPSSSRTSPSQKPGRRIALFGGSFDPPHFAHVLAVAHLAAGPFDEVWVIPCAGHPFGKQLAPFADRMAMCRAAFGFMRNVRVIPIEDRLPKPTLTLNTLRELKRLHPHVNFTLAFGADVIAQRRRWHRFDRIEKEAEVVFFRRPGFGGGKGISWISSVEFGDISSTKIRRALATGRNASHLVPARVLEEIGRRGLYRVRRNRTKRPH